MTTETVQLEQAERTSAPTLEIDDLHIAIDGTEIIKGISLAVNKGEVHALMGPNGSGKSTLAATLMGHPRYEVTGGDIRYKGESILAWSPDQRARAGIFLGSQYPTAIPGVTMVNFLRQSLNAQRGVDVPVREFRTLLTEKMQLLKMDQSFARRYVNDGFSGGEKKRAEILQMHVFQPQIAVLDETDSGLDVDALRVVAEGVEEMTGPDLGVLLITHYYRILNYINPDYVHVLVDGKLVRSGGAELARQVEENGYENILESIDGGREAGGSRVE